MPKIKVNAGFVSREYSLEDDSCTILITNSNFLTTLLEGLPHTLEWKISYTDLGIDRHALELGLNKMAEGCLIQDALPSLGEDKVEMLLDHPDFRLTECPVVN